MPGRLEAGGPPDAAARMREVGKWRAMVERLLGFKRALSQKPDWLFLDEATSAADEATEACLYRLLRERLAGTTAFSVGHRGTLRPFHACHFVVQPNGSGRASIVEVAAVTGC